MQEIVLPVALRGLIIHLMNPQLLSLDEDGTIQILAVIVQALWLLAERANDYYSQVEGSTYLERFAC
jgi:hypothetical protein